MDEENIREKVSQSTHEEAKIKSEIARDHTDPCVICLDAVRERAIALPCRHQSFDFLCLLSWLEECSKCPLCKSEVHSVEYGSTSPKDCKIYKVPSNTQAKPPSGHVSSAAPRDEGFNLRRTRRLRQTWQSRRPRPAPSLSPDAALLRRRHIYHNKLYSLHVGSNRLSRFQDLTPGQFNQDNELITRARKWIRRELQVFEFLNPDAEGAEGLARGIGNTEFLLEYIIAILKTVDIKGSGGQAEDMLHEFLGRENTRLFLHELRAWLRSPYTSLEDWDRHVQYSGAPVATRNWKSQDAAHHAPGPEGRASTNQPVWTDRSRWRPEDRNRRHDRYIPYDSHPPPRHCQRRPSEPG